MPDTIQPVEGFDSVLKFYTDEQLQAVQERAAVLMRTDPDLNKICSVLIASRQLYALARFALHRELVTEDIKWEDGVEEFLIKAMADRATKAFSRTETFKIMASTVKKFMTDEINLESEAERTQELIRTQRDYDLRVRRVITGNGIWLQSGELMLVVGTDDQLRRLVNSLTSKDTTNYYMSDEDKDKAKPLNLDVCARVVFSTDEPEHKPNCKVYPVSEWRECCANGSEFTRFMASVKDLAPFNRVDLLIVQDVEPLKSGTDKLLTSHASVKTVRKLVKSQAAAAVLGYVVDSLNDVDAVVEKLKQKYKDIEGVIVTTVLDVEGQHAESRPPG